MKHSIIAAALFSVIMISQLLMGGCKTAPKAAPVTKSTFEVQATGKPRSATASRPRRRTEAEQEALAIARSKALNILSAQYSNSGGAVENAVTRGTISSKFFNAFDEAHIVYSITVKNLQPLATATRGPARKKWLNESKEPAVVMVRMQPGGAPGYLAKTMTAILSEKLQQRYDYQQVSGPETLDKEESIEYARANSIDFIIFTSFMPSSEGSTITLRTNFMPLSLDEEDFISPVEDSAPGPAVMLQKLESHGDRVANLVASSKYVILQ